MKILVVLSTFSPHTYGGGEVAALNFATWMQQEGHEVGVVTMAGDDDTELRGEVVDGFKVWRLKFPRPYAYWNHVKATKWLKPLWYMQDHFDPRNTLLLAGVLEEFQPDFVDVHVVSGIGYNGLKEVGKRGIPAIYHLHDLSLACMWGGMYKKGKTCETQCLECRCVSKIRFGAVSSIPHVGFHSPSHSNMNKLKKFLPIAKHLNAAVINPNIYPEPTISRAHDDTKGQGLRFLYVGRVHVSKGLDVLLSALEILAARYMFSIDILGEGADLFRLKETYGKHAWCHFHGHVSQVDVSNFMVKSDLLCVPSVWEEPLGLVVVHALLQGLPVIGSNIGGIPEMIEHTKNGLLVKPGDVNAWTLELENILKDQAPLKEWSLYAESHKHTFDRDALAQELWKLVEAVYSRSQAEK